MSDAPFPDIEVYVRSVDTPSLIAWLADTLSATLDQTSAHTWQGKGIGSDDSEIPCLLIERAVGGFTSLWLDSAATPWSRDIDCARALHDALGGEVRCSPGSWQPGEQPDTFVKLINGVESMIEWK